MFKDYLKERILSVVKSWDSSDIYAVSLLIEFNESDCYKKLEGFPDVTLMCNTESECEGDSRFCEERWNIAFWDGENDEIIIDSSKKDKMSKMLISWYKEIGVENIGYEDDEKAYDDEMEYIGKGPNGFWELATVLADVAKEIHNIKNEYIDFASIPVIINDYDYSWYTYDFTKSANPDGQAGDFLKYFDDECR